MAPPKSIDSQNALAGAISAPTPLTFARAAGLANLSVATLVFVEFSGIAIVNHDGAAFKMGLWLIPFVTLVVWSSASVLYLVFLTAGLLGTLWRRLIGPTRFSPSGRSGLWDDWLDSPAPRHP